MRATLRIISLFTTICFLWTQSVLGVPRAAVVGDERSEKKPAEEGNLQAGSSQMSPADINALVHWHVPETYGSVQERFQGSAEKVIFHIQDTHANYESQMHAVKILQMLLAGRFKDKIRLIGVEGTYGRIDVSGFKIYPNKDILKDVADYFLRQARLSGSEFFSILHEGPLVVHGIEDLDLYVADLKDFLLSHGTATQIDPILTGLKDAYQKTLQAVYNPQALEFMKLLEAYKKGDIEFSTYCEKLSQFAFKAGASTKPYTAFEKILEALRVEKGIAKDKVEKERTALIEALDKKMVKEDLSGLIGKSLLYRTGKMSSSEFYDYLAMLATKYSIGWDSFKNLRGYIQMVRLQSDVKVKEVLAQCDRLEAEIKERWLASGLEKDFAGALKKLSLLEDLVHLRMTRSDLDFYEKHKDTIRAAALADFLKAVLAKRAVATADGWQIQTAGGQTIVQKSQLAEVGRIDEHLATMQAFYQKALLRDHALVKNTLRLMEQNKADAAVMVTGGFHTEGTMKLFAGKGISYVVVNPRLTKIDQGELYMARMLNKEMPLEKFFSSLRKSIDMPKVLGPRIAIDRIELPDGTEYQLNTEDKKRALKEELQVLYAMATAERAMEDGQEITRAELKGLEAPSLPRWERAKKVQQAGAWELQALFTLDDQQFVLRMPFGREFDLAQVQPIKLAKSAFAPVPPILPTGTIERIEAAERHIDEGRYVLALEMYRKLLEENPTDKGIQKEFRQALWRMAQKRVRVLSLTNKDGKGGMVGEGGYLREKEIPDVIASFLGRGEGDAAIAQLLEDLSRVEVDRNDGKGQVVAHLGMGASGTELFAAGVEELYLLTRGLGPTGPGDSVGQALRWEVEERVRENQSALEGMDFGYDAATVAAHYDLGLAHALMGNAADARKNLLVILYFLRMTWNKLGRPNRLYDDVEKELLRDPRLKISPADVLHLYLIVHPRVSVFDKCIKFKELFNYYEGKIPPDDLKKMVAALCKGRPPLLKVINDKWDVFSQWPQVMREDFWQRHYPSLSGEDSLLLHEISLIIAPRPPPDDVRELEKKLSSLARQYVFLATYKELAGVVRGSGLGMAEKDAREEANKTRAELHMRLGEDYYFIGLLIEKVKGQNDPQALRFLLEDVTNLVLDKYIQAAKEIAHPETMAESLETIHAARRLVAVLNDLAKDSFLLSGLAKGMDGKTNPSARALLLNDLVGLATDPALRQEWRREQRDTLRELRVSHLAARAPPQPGVESARLEPRQIGQMVRFVLGFIPEAEFVGKLITWQEKVGAIHPDQLLTILMDARIQLLASKYSAELILREIGIRLIQEHIFITHPEIECVINTGSAGASYRTYKPHTNILLASDTDPNFILKKGLTQDRRELIVAFEKEIKELAEAFGLRGMVVPHVLGREFLEQPPTTWPSSPEITTGQVDGLAPCLTLSYAQEWTGELYCFRGEKLVALPDIPRPDRAEGFEFCITQIGSFERTLKTIPPDASSADRVTRLSKYVLRAARGYLVALGNVMTPKEIQQARQGELTDEEDVLERVRSQVARGQATFTQDQIDLLDLLKRLRLGEPAEGASLPTVEEMKTFILDMLRKSAPVYVRDLQRIGGLFKMLSESDPRIQDVDVSWAKVETAVAEDEVLDGDFRHDVVGKICVIHGYLEILRKAEDSEDKKALSKECHRMTGVLNSMQKIPSEKFRGKAEQIRLWLLQEYRKYLWVEMGKFLNRVEAAVASLIEATVDESTRTKLTRIVNESVEAIRVALSQYKNECKDRELPVTKEAVDLGEIARSIVIVAKEEVALGQDIKVRYEIPEGIKPELDPGRLRAILDNLIKNAFQAMAQDSKEKKVLIISARVVGSDLVLEVKDSGGGIDCREVYKKAKNLVGARRFVADALKGIEEPTSDAFNPQIANLLFLRYMTVGKKEGTGIGLDVVARKMKEQGGDVEVTSKLVERTVFTVFTLRFPEAVVAVPEVAPQPVLPPALIPRAPEAVPTPWRLAAQAALQYCLILLSALQEILPNGVTVQRLMIFTGLFFLASPVPAMAAGAGALVPYVLPAVGGGLIVVAPFVNNALERLAPVTQPAWEKAVVDLFLTYRPRAGEGLSNLFLGGEKEENEEVFRDFVKKLQDQIFGKPGAVQGLGDLPELVKYDRVTFRKELLAPEEFFKKIEEYLAHLENAPAVFLYLYAKTLYERWERRCERTGRWASDSDFVAAFNIMNVSFRGVLGQFSKRSESEIARHFLSRSSGKAAVPGSPGLEIVEADPFYPRLLELQENFTREVALGWPEAPSPAVGIPPAAAMAHQAARVNPWYQRAQLILGVLFIGVALVALDHVVGAVNAHAAMSNGVVITAVVITAAALQKLALPLMSSVLGSLGIVPLLFWGGIQVMERKLLEPATRDVLLPGVKAAVIVQLKTIGHQQLKDILKDGVSEQRDKSAIQGLSAEKMNQLIETYPAALLRLVLDRQPNIADGWKDALSKVAVDYLKERKVLVSADKDKLQADLVSWAGVLNKDVPQASAKVLHLEHFVKIERDEAGNIIHKEILDPVVLYQNLWRSKEPWLVSYQLSPEEFDVVRGELEAKFGPLGIQLQRMVFRKIEVADDGEVKDFRDHVIARVQTDYRVANPGEELPENAILILATVESFRDIWMQDAGDLLIALFDPDRNYLVLSGRQIDTLLKAGVQLGPQDLNGVLLVPETRMTVEQRALAAEAVALSA